jgi:hypothetical protein
VEVGRRYLSVRSLLEPQAGERDDAVRFVIGERFEQHCIHDTEYSGIGPDAKRHHQHGQQREAWVLEKRAEREFQVHGGRVQQVQCQVKRKAGLSLERIADGLVFACGTDPN